MRVEILLKFSCRCCHLAKRIMTKLCGWGSNFRTVTWRHLLTKTDKTNAGLQKQRLCVDFVYHLKYKNKNCVLNDKQQKQTHNVNKCLHSV